jgi:hypothetical protein
MPRISQTFVLCCLLSFACGTCNKAVPLEAAPGNLKEVSIVIDDLPAETKGQWITVSGWVDKTVVHGVFVVGAPVPGFYQGFGGHMGIPSVPVVLRDDGRFVAARVPLVNGDNKIQVIPLAKGGLVFKTQEKMVKGSDATFVPATLVPDVDTAKPLDTVTFRAASGDGADNWQFDFDGDGTFDAEGQRASHRYEVGGTYVASARTRVGDQWVYATTVVAVEEESTVLKSTNDVIQPSRLWVYDKTHREDGKGLVVDERLVVAIDGAQVRVFDGELKPKFTLSGLTAPRDVAVEYGKEFCVLDEGNRVVAFAWNGELDRGFGVQGSVAASGEKTFADAYSIGCADFGKRLVGNLKNYLSFECSPTNTGCVVKPRQRPTYDTTNFSTDAIQRYDFGVLVTEKGNAYAYGDDLLRVPVGKKAVSGFVGPEVTVGTAMVLDDSGMLHRYSAYYNHNASYKLSFAISAAASDELGQVWVAGQQRIELRSIKPLPGSGPWEIP